MIGNLEPRPPTMTCDGILQHALEYHRQACYAWQRASETDSSNKHCIFINQVTCWKLKTFLVPIKKYVYWSLYLSLFDYLIINQSHSVQRKATWNQWSIAYWRYSKMLQEKIDFVPTKLEYKISSGKTPTGWLYDIAKLKNKFSLQNINCDWWNKAHYYDEDITLSLWRGQINYRYSKIWRNLIVMVDNN